MRKILFSAEVKASLKKDAKSIVLLLNDLFDYSHLDTRMVLDNVVKNFHYKSYGDFCAVNKSDRFFLDFSLSVVHHVRLISAKLSESLNIHEHELLVVASMLELGFEYQPKLGFRVDSKSKYPAMPNKLVNKKFVMVMRPNLGHPELVNLFERPNAALFLRNAITIENIKCIFPELTKWLISSFEAKYSDLIGFQNNTLWETATDLSLAADSHYASYLKIVIQNEKITGTRTIYEGLHEDCFNDDRPEMDWESVCESIYEAINTFKLIDNTIDGDMSDQNYVLKLIDDLLNLNDGLSISLHSSIKVQDSAVDYITDDDKILLLLHHKKSNDLTMGSSLMELRQTDNFIDDLCLSPSKTKDYLEVDEKVHNENQKTVLDKRDESLVNLHLMLQSGFLNDLFSDVDIFEHS